jgi:hypothetical protein
MGCFFLAVLMTACGAAAQQWTYGSLEGSPQNLTTITVSPDVNHTVWVGTAAEGIYKSADGGATWTSSNNGLPSDESSPAIFRVTVNSIAAEPQNPQFMLAGTSGGLFRSTDAGGSWWAVPAFIRANNPLNNVVAVAADPIIPARWYAFGDKGKEMYVSTDDGQNWVKTNSPVSTMNSANSLALSPATFPIYAATEAGVEVLSSGGGTWKTALGDQALAVAVDPLTNGTVYATTTGGLSRSVDGGVTWMALASAPNGRIEGLFVDTSSTVFIAVTSSRTSLPINQSRAPEPVSGGLWSSADGGETWINLGGVAGRGVNTVVRDAETQSVYASFAGAGVGVLHERTSQLPLAEGRVPRPSAAAESSTATASSSPSVSKISPPLSWLPPAAIPYGTTLSGTQLDAQVASAVNRMVAYGDSLTAGNEGGTGISYPNQLALKTGGIVFNRGIGSQASSQIAVRMNAYAGTQNQTFAAGFTIPTSGNVVVTFQKGYEPAYRTNSTNAISITTTVNGVAYPGLVQDNGSEVYQFTPTPYPASPVAVPAGNPWKTVLGSLLNGCVVLEEGRNNYEDAAIVEADIAASVAAVKQSTQCYFVMGILNGGYLNELRGQPGYNKIVALNSYLSTVYGVHYVDVRSEMVADYNSANAADVIDHTNDVPPMSLRAGDGSGTVTAIATPSTCAFETSAGLVGNGQILTIEAEEILLTGGEGGESGYTCVRGYAGTTPSTYAAGTVYSSIDLIHPGQSIYSAANPNCANGYTCMADQVFNAYVGLAGAISQVAGTFTYCPAAGAVLAPGAHTLLVTFTPEDTTTYAVSTASVSLVVNKAPPKVSISTPPNPVSVGSAIALTATVAPVASGLIPTGTVNFYVDYVGVGKVSLVAGKATYSLSALAAGKHTFEVQYNGDTNYTGANAPVLSVTVNKIATNVAVSSSLNPSTLGTPVTISAIINGTLAGTPSSGIVNFYSGNTLIGKGTLVGDGASFATSALPHGVDTISVQFWGDANYLPSRSPNLSEIVY